MTVGRGIGRVWAKDGGAMHGRDTGPSMITTQECRHGNTKRVAPPAVSGWPLGWPGRHLPWVLGVSGKEVADFEEGATGGRGPQKADPL